MTNKNENVHELTNGVVLVVDARQKQFEYLGPLYWIDQHLQVIKLLAELGGDDGFEVRATVDDKSSNLGQQYALISAGDGVVCHNEERNTADDTVALLLHQSEPVHIKE